MIMKKFLCRIVFLTICCCACLDTFGQSTGGIYVYAGYGVSHPELFEKENGRKFAPYYLVGVNYSGNKTFSPSFGIAVDRRDTKSKNSMNHAYYNYFNFEAGMQWQASKLRLGLGGWGPFIGGEVTRDGVIFEKLRNHRIFDPSDHDFGAWLNFSMPIGTDQFSAFFKSRIGLHPYVTNNTHNTFALGLAMKVFDVK
jgi:hypothetical protein